MPNFFDDEDDDTDQGSDLPQGYDTAQICKNGHLITAYVESIPEHTKNNCTICGEPTISSCDHCGQPIQGVYHIPIIGAVGNYTVPKFCHNCGKPYVWTIRQMEAAKKIIDLAEGLQQNDREDLKIAIDDIVKDSPNAKPAAYKIRAALKKIPGEAQTMLRDLIVNIASEAIVKIIMPDR